MKKIDFKNKKTTWWLIGLLIVIILLILFFKGLNGKPLFNSKNNNNLVDIANSKEYTKYNGVAKANFEGESLLDFSFLHRNEIKIVQGSGDQARWYKLIDASSTNNVTLYFTYEGGRGYSIDDYIDNVLKTNNASITVEQVKFTDEDSPIVKRIIDNDTNTEYYIEAITSNDGSS